jgi:hypothetical protein
MDTHRVDVLDRAHDDAVVRAVAHDLELELLPPGDRLLDEDLVHGADLQAPSREGRELVPGRGEPAPPAAERERRSHDERVADALGRRQGLLERSGDLRPRHLEAGLEHRLLEAAPVLCAMDRLEARADQPDAQAVEIAGLGEGHRDVQRGLAAERREHGVGAFALEDREDGPGRQRLDVRAVGERRVGHDRRRVRVHERDLEALLAQHLAGLRARVVELAGLADHDRARADDHDLADVGASRHQRLISSRKSSNR